MYNTSFLLRGKYLLFKKIHFRADFKSFLTFFSGVVSGATRIDIRVNCKNSPPNFISNGVVIKN